MTASYPHRPACPTSFVPPAERLARGITGRLVRLSVGLEDPGDLIEDFEQALERAKKSVRGRAGCAQDRAVEYDVYYGVASTKPIEAPLMRRLKDSLAVRRGVL